MHVSGVCCPVWARERRRISSPRFLAECCKSQLNQGSFVLLYFRLFTFSDLCWVCLSVFSCTVSFVSISQVIGCEDRLRNDLYCVEWSVKLYPNQPTRGMLNLPPPNGHIDRVSCFSSIYRCAQHTGRHSKPTKRVARVAIGRTYVMHAIRLKSLFCWLL